METWTCTCPTHTGGGEAGNNPRPHQCATHATTRPSAHALYYTPVALTFSLIIFFILVFSVSWPTCPSVLASLTKLVPSHKSLPFRLLLLLFSISLPILFQLEARFWYLRQFHLCSYHLSTFALQSYNICQVHFVSYLLIYHQFLLRFHCFVSALTISHVSVC
jgi:hypothetical protein